MKRFKIYSGPVNCWYNKDDRGLTHLCQIELPYKMYDADNNYELVADGTEDFSEDRYRDIMTRLVYVWDGAKRNKGGHRWFNCFGYIRYHRKDTKTVKEYIKARYNAALVELR